MQNQQFSRTGIIKLILVAQFIPLLLLPPDSFSPNSQEWWLPALLTVMATAGAVELIGRHSPAVWPWNLMSFAQGFNIISRLMLLWPHATLNAQGTTVLNFPYIMLTFISILLSGFLLSFIERPDVRMLLVE